MNEIFYRDLKACFEKIRSYFSSSSLDKNKLNAALGDLRFFKKQIEKRGKRKEKKLLIYCIDTLFRMIEEDDREKVYAFAGLSRDITDIFLGERNFYSFGEEIKSFNKRFRECCFDDMKKIYPYFSKKAPKNALEFFSPESDEAFKAQHPIGYVVLVISGIIAFLLPLLLYGICVLGKLDDQSVGGWPFLAIIGCFVMGIGLFNIVAAFIHQYLGHKLTVISLLGGGICTAAATFMMWHPEWYDGNVSVFYFASLFTLLFPAAIYGWFRLSMGSWLKRAKRISRSKFRKLTKGKRNFWWYEALHKELNLGAIYYFNKFFVILWALLFLLTLFTGFIKIMSLILCPMYVLLCILTACMMVFAKIQDNLDDHGKAIVLWAKTSNGGWDSFIFDVILVCFILAMAYVNIMLVGEIWGVSLPALL